MVAVPVEVLAEEEAVGEVVAGEAVAGNPAST